MHRDHVARRGRQAEPGEVGAEALEGGYDFIGGGGFPQRHAYRLGVSGNHTGTGAGRAYFNRWLDDRAFADTSQDLAGFDLDAFFLARNIGDDVLDDVERRQV